jgi:hypothetical protein
MNLRWTVLLIAVWLAAPTVAQAQEGEDAQEGQALNRQQRERRPSRGFQARAKRIREQLELDADQQAEYDRIVDKYNKRRGGAADSKRLRELEKELQRARQTGDDERAAEVRDEMRAARGGGPIEPFLDEIEGILRDDQLKKLVEIREELAEDSTRGPAALAELKTLRRRLRLSRDQDEQYDQRYEELKSDLAAGRGGGEEMDTIVKELMKAVEAGDEERIQELRTQLPNPSAQAEIAVAHFLDDIEEFLEPEQLETLEAFRHRMDRGRGGKVSLREYFRFATKLDLDKEQQEALRDLRKQTQRSEREARRDKDALAALTAETQEELRSILTDEQCAEFDRWLADRESEKTRRGFKTMRKLGGGHKARKPKPADKETP